MSENENPVATTPDATPAIPEATAPALEAAPVAATTAAPVASPVASPVVAKKTTGKGKKTSSGGRKKVALDAKRAGGFFMVDPDDVLIADDPGHPLYEAERNVLPLDPCFVKNIAKRGVKLPILIRKNGDRVEVVDGRLRIRAAREVNKALREAGEKPMLVRAILEHGGDADLVAISGAAQIRTEESPLNKAKRAAKLVAYGYSTADIAIELGVSEKAVEQWLQIVDLSQSMQTAISLGHLSSTAALKFKNLTHEEQDAAVRSMTTTPAAQTTKSDADNDQTQAPTAKPVKVKRVTEREARAAAGGIVKPGLKTIKKVRSGLIGQSVFVVAWMLGEIDARELVKEVPSAKAGLEAAGLLVGDDKSGPGAKGKKGKKGKKAAKKSPAKKSPAKKTTRATLDETVASVTGKVLAGLGLSSK